jgi:hypothetical protein
MDTACMRAEYACVRSTYACLLALVLVFGVPSLCRMSRPMLCAVRLCCSTLVALGHAIMCVMLIKVLHSRPEACAQCLSRHPLLIINTLCFAL